MKIIFDNEWEKTRLILAHCPTDVCCDTIEDPYCDSSSCNDICERCWENSGIGMEVKKDD